MCLSLYTSESYDLLVDLNEVLNQVAGRAADANLTLLADAVGCCTLLVSGRLEAAVALAMSVQQRAEFVDHPMAGYVSTAPLIIGALRAGRPTEGIPWVDRCVAMHLRLGTGAIGMFTETRANFEAQLGDYARATRTYAAASIATRRAAMVWPNRELTRPLLAMTRDHLGRSDFELAWQEGERVAVIGP